MEKEFNTTIDILRRMYKYSYIDLGKLCKTSPQTVKIWCSGQVRKVSHANFSLLCRAFKIDDPDMMSLFRELIFDDGNTMMKGYAFDEEKRVKLLEHLIESRHYVDANNDFLKTKYDNLPLCNDGEKTKDVLPLIFKELYGKIDMEIYNSIVVNALCDNAPKMKELIPYILDNIYAKVDVGTYNRITWEIRNRIYDFDL